MSEADEMSVLLDTAFLVAYCDEDDQDHARATKLAKELDSNMFGQLYISDYIFDETITLLKKYIGNKSATERGLKLLNSTTLLKIDSQVFDLSWEFSTKFDHLSFTDCTNVILMRHYKIGHIATFDSGFDGVVKVLR
ncbi:type II toxin-antitoxin system VapC family toxin [Candidatus Micrarchaeota archaeon]|nr:type II toxin-antitoxin system VapC family toxin [Candidatus Micrarchaeota archaeon]